MKSSLRIGHILGVPLRDHWTVPLLVFLFGSSLGSGTLPAWVPGQSTTAYTLAGIIGALLLLLSLLAHESAHAVAARRKGIPVRNVTLWALGGMTEMDKPPAPGAAFLVAVSGPLRDVQVPPVVTDGPIFGYEPTRCSELSSRRSPASARPSRYAFAVGAQFPGSCFRLMGLGYST
ncbi:site-2 protease family protein [Streptomyces cupreus]|uniref:site-2 protease family protein n=1 Tax=Streptomyces cupreus TaxID=2759956 RepID=UPI0021B29150|nr:site-2 protease family protein [Streptomyces cupreus]